MAIDFREIVLVSIFLTATYIAVSETVVVSENIDVRHLAHPLLLYYSLSYRAPHETPRDVGNRCSI